MKTVNGLTDAQLATLYDSALKMEESGVRIVVNASGAFEITAKHLARVTAAKMRPLGVVWTPEEMLRYIGMSRKERDVFRGLKHTWRGTSTFE